MRNYRFSRPLGSATKEKYSEKRSRENHRQAPDDAPHNSGGVIRLGREATTRLVAAGLTGIEEVEVSLTEVDATVDGSGAAESEKPMYDWARVMLNVFPA